MRLSVLRAALVASFASCLVPSGTVLGQAAPPPLRVTRDPQNVVASRLLGDWTLDSTLTERLAGAHFPRMEGFTDPVRRLSFRADTTILALIPEAQLVKVRAMPGLIVVLAGTATVNDQRDLPFIVLGINGTSHVMYWVPVDSRPGDRFANGESFIASIAAAREPFNDLLLVGGDFNNQPFIAFGRAGVRVPSTR